MQSLVELEFRQASSEKIFIYWMLSASSNTSLFCMCNQHKLDIIALCMCSGMQTSFMFVFNQVEGELDKTPHPTVRTVQSLFQWKSLIQSNSISYLTKH